MVHGTTSSDCGDCMDIKVVYANPNGTLSILPEPAAAGTSPWRPSSMSLAAVYLTLSSVAIASNAMVLTSVVTTDRLRTPYAVLVSALCLQCVMDAAAGHYAATRELLAGGGGGAALCRGLATITVGLSTVELVTFAALACVNAFVRPDYGNLPLAAAAALWAAPSVYTYIILTPTLLFSTRYFPSRGRCGFIANTTNWFYPSLLIIFSFMIPWSISFYFVFIFRPSATPKSANIILTSTKKKNQMDLIPTKFIFISYTILVTPSFMSSCVYLYRNSNDNPWIENEAEEDILDGYLSKLPIVFDLFVPLIIIYYHKVFRKKCRELYMHGFRNSVSDGRQISIERLKRSKNHEYLTDDAPVLFLEQSGKINVRFPSEDGFMIKECDLKHDENNSNRKKAVRFAKRATNENGIYSTGQPKNEESCL